MENLNVIVTGYVNSGSSAVIDLLKEFTGVKEAKPKLVPAYEHVLFYVPNGIFDLEYKLLYNNDPHRSDEAITEFKKKMLWLYEKNFGWFGGYKKEFSEEFIKILEELINSISMPHHKNLIWYNRYKDVKFSVVKLVLQLFSKMLYNKKIYKWGRKYIYDRSESFFSIIEEEEFIEAMHKFTSDYANLWRKESEVTLIFDHMIWPQQLNKKQRFFDDSFKIIVVDRDPRDIYYRILERSANNLNQNFFNAKKEEIVEFCQKWEFTHSFKGVSNDVLRLNFEDLIYNYSDTINNIKSFVGLQDSEHGLKGKYFIPKKSRLNTALFMKNDKYKEEISEVEEYLKDYLFDFKLYNV